jgi:hypothetical protein
MRGKESAKQETNKIPPLASADIQPVGLTTVFTPAASYYTLLNTQKPQMAHRETPTFDALPYYDDDANADPDLALKVRQELARERKKLGQRVAPDRDPRIAPQFSLFAVRPIAVLLDVPRGSHCIPMRTCRRIRY